MAAKKATIFPQISAEANALLLQVCAAQGCAPGMVVEAALQALLNPREVTDRDAVLIQGQVQLHDDLVAMLSFHKQILAMLEARTSGAVGVATFDQLYAAEEAQREEDEAGEEAQTSVSEVVQPGGWRKLFPKREKREWMPQRSSHP